MQHNRGAWNRHANNGSPWSGPVSAEEVARAREGDWEVILAPNKAVSADWFGDIVGQEVLGLASAGARVMSFDNSDEQLARDKLVTERGLFAFTGAVLAWLIGKFIGFDLIRGQGQNEVSTVDCSDF